MHQRAALNAREDRRVHLFRDLVVIGQDHAAARAAQGLVGGRRRHMGMREGAGVKARGHQTGEVRHVDQKVSPHGIGDFPHLRKVDDARDGRAAGDDHLRLVLGGQGLDLVVIQPQVLLAHAILHRMEPLARLVRRRAMGQVAAGVQAHAQDGVAGLQKRLEHALVGLATRSSAARWHERRRTACRPARSPGFRRYQRIGSRRNSACRDSPRHICWSSPSLAPPSRRAETMFSLSDQLDLVALPAQLLRHRPEKLGVARGKRFAEKAGVAVGGHGGRVLRGQWGWRPFRAWQGRGKGRKATDKSASQAAPAPVPSGLEFAPRPGQGSRQGRQGMATRIRFSASRAPAAIEALAALTARYGQADARARRGDRGAGRRRVHAADAARPDRARPAGLWHELRHHRLSDERLCRGRPARAAGRGRGNRDQPAVDAGRDACAAR
jgi:hypothetical protein